jgi:hypothetical protein
VAAVIDLKFRGEPNVEANLSIMIGTAALIEEVVCGARILPAASGELPIDADRERRR